MAQNPGNFLMGVWPGPYKMQTHDLGIKLGFYCTLFDFLENKIGYFGAE
jgi:hypothetical protein